MTKRKLKKTHGYKVGDTIEYKGKLYRIVRKPRAKK